MQKRTQDYDSNYAVKLDFDKEAEDIQYKRPMGAYRPRFQSIPQDYHPSSCCQILFCFAIIVVIIAGGLGLMIGMLIWDFTWKTPKFILFWAIFMVAFIVLFFLSVFFGGRAHIAKERKLVREKLNKIFVEQKSQTQDRLKM